jgi:hypothetical protein
VREAVNEHRNESPQTEHCRRRPEPRAFAGAVGNGVAPSTNAGSHALLDFEGKSSIPESVSAQRAGEIHEFVLVEIGDDPVGHIRPIPMENLVALRVLLLDPVVGRAPTRPHEYIDVVHSALINQSGGGPVIHIVEAAADQTQPNSYIRHGGRKIKFALEPGLDCMAIRGRHIDQVPGLK